MILLIRILGQKDIFLWRLWNLKFLWLFMRAGIITNYGEYMFTFGLSLGHKDMFLRCFVEPKVFMVSMQA